MKELIAPDSAQFYLAAAMGKRLAAIYVVQRGNRRVYVHLEVAQTADAEVQDVAGLLARKGFAVLADATPASDGTLASSEIAALAALAQQLSAVAGGPLHVVCHLPGTVETALARSQRCAEQAAAALRDGGAEAVPFAAGPLLPRPGVSAARLELVAPSAAR